MNPSIAALATGPYLAACVLLAAGAGKLRHPASARAAARALGLPHSLPIVYALGGIELVAALAGVAFGGWAAGTVGALYALLGVAALRLWKGAPATPCGCLGRSDAPAGLGHVLVDAACASVALVVAFGARPVSVIAAQPHFGVPFVALVACAAWLAALAVSAWPVLRAAMREGSA
jgi:Methylamine utilisation protein MauE